VTASFAPGQCTRIAEPSAGLSRIAAVPASLWARATVLLVEDHQEVRNVLARALRKAGLLVVEAGDALAARAAIEAGRIDAVVTDIALPGRINGVELGNWVRFRAPAMPLVFITGLVDGEIPGELVRDALSCFLIKPFAMRVLVERLAALLAAAGGAPADPESRIAADQVWLPFA
jgi:DNA-binding response OmpR family regulator